jgi:hypothetical protein
MAMGCLIRVTTAQAKGLKSVIYVVAEPKPDAAIAILGRQVSAGSKVEPLGPVVESYNSPSSTWLPNPSRTLASPNECSFGAVE